MAGWLRRIFGQADDEDHPPRPIEQTSPPDQTNPAPAHGPPGARRPGVIYRSDHLSPEREAEVFELDASGLPTGSLMRRSDRLVIVPDGLPAEMVNPRSTRLYRLGIYSFAVRGTGHHTRAARAGDFRPGEPVRLVREPGNEHDSNAIAVYAQGASEPAGYVNRQNAGRLAKRLDAGEDMTAIVTRGDGPGHSDSAIVVLVARPRSSLT